MKPEMERGVRVCYAALDAEYAKSKGWSKALEANLSVLRSVRL